MRKIFALLFASQILISCSVYQASTGDRKRDLNVLAPGSSRDIVLAELGTPASSIDNLSTAPANTNSAGQDKSRYDIFSFVQGRSKGANVGRSLFYGTAAVFTLGLSEVVAAPLEHVVGDAGNIKLRVNYDENWKVVDSKIFDKGEWVTPEQLKVRVAERQAASGNSDAAVSN